jgi:hypothetical protein
VGILPDFDGAFQGNRALSAGVSAVVVVDAEASTVTLQGHFGARLISRRGEQLDLSDVIPGFRCAVDGIFN